MLVVVETASPIVGGAGIAEAASDGPDSANVARGIAPSQNELDEINRFCGLPHNYQRDITLRHPFPVDLRTFDVMSHEELCGFRPRPGATMQYVHPTVKDWKVLTGDGLDMSSDAKLQIIERVKRAMNDLHDRGLRHFTQPLSWIMRVSYFAIREK